MSKTLKKNDTKVPIYKKYANTVPSNWLDPSVRLKPSDLAKPSIDIVASDFPKILRLNTISDNTSQVHSTVDLDQPLFQPSPKIVVFEEYAPFTVVEKKIFFRNNDSVQLLIIHRHIQCKFTYFDPTVGNKKNQVGET